MCIEVTRKAALRYSACIGTMNPLTAWSSGFSRSGDAQPPKGGTPYQRRFMESPHDSVAVHWDHEPERVGLGRQGAADVSSAGLVEDSSAGRMPAAPCLQPA